MNLSWNLTEFFKTSEEFYEEIEKIKTLLLKIKEYETVEIDENILFEMLDKKWKIKALANNVLVYGSLKYYKNIKSEEAIKLKSTAENFSTQVDLDLGFIDRKILELGKEKVNEFTEKNVKLKAYGLVLDNLFRMQEHVQDSDISQIIKDNINRINEQLSKYNNFLKDLKYGEIEIDGQKIEITSANFSKYLVSKDRETRKQTYLTVNQSFKESQIDFANILDSIFGIRIQNAKLENYDSVLEKVLFEENIDVEIINTLIEAVNNNLVLIQKYLKIKSDFLGIDNPHLYDFGVSLESDLKIHFTIEEAIDIVKEALKPLGTDYLKVVEQLLEGHMDVQPDDNKHQSITFSWNTYSFMNFRGSYIDLKNLIHELGHIVNYYLSKNNVLSVYEDSTIFIGETASIVNEILLNKYLFENAKTESEKIFYLSKEIENYFTSIFKQVMYTEFEQKLYSSGQSQKLTADLLSEKYDELIKKYYGDNVCYDDVSSVEWTRLGHLYRWSYYPYKYATGLIMASVVVDFIVNKQCLSQEKYLEFLSSGSSLYPLDLLKMLDIDLTDLSIINDGFKVMADDIEQLEKILILKNH